MSAQPKHTKQLSEPGLAFAGLDGGPLCIEAGLQQPQAFVRYMAGMRRRQPDNLKRHVQYLVTLLQMPEVDSEQLFAGLVDLFIALGDGGLALRRRLLARSRPWLQPAALAFLRPHLDGGMDSNTPLPPGCKAVLTGGVSGLLDFASREQLAGNGFASLYEEAVSQLEYGEVEQAQELLEKALREQPRNEEIAAELVAIYRHRRDTESQAAMSQWFISNDLPLPMCWPLL